MPKPFSRGAGAVVVGRGSDDGYVHALQFVHLGVIDLGEDELVAQAERVVAATSKLFDETPRKSRTRGTQS